MCSWATILAIKGYLSLHNSGRVYIARHVLFNEFDFPFASRFRNDFAQASSSPYVASAHVLPETWHSVPIDTIPQIVSPHQHGSLSHSRSSFYCQSVSGHQISQSVVASCDTNYGFQIAASSSPECEEEHDVADCHLARPSADNSLVLPQDNISTYSYYFYFCSTLNTSYGY